MDLFGEEDGKNFNW